MNPSVYIETTIPSFYFEERPEPRGCTAMRNDPVIEAVREVRHRISESVGHDPHRLVAYYRQRQEHRQDRQLPQLSGAGGRAPQREEAEGAGS